MIAFQEAPPVPTLDGPGLTKFLAQDEQVIIGVVQKGQCGEPCDKLEKMMAKMMVKMDGFFNAAIVDVRTAVDTGVAGDEQTIHSMFNITTIPLIFIYGYGVKDVRRPMMLQQETIGQVIGAYDMPQHQKQVHDTFLQFLPTKVTQVKSGNLKEWLQEEPHKARVLLVTSKKATPPMFTKLSVDFANGVKFGELRESYPGAVEELKKLGGPEVTKFPKLLLGPALGEGYAAPTTEYKGALNLKSIGAEIAKINPGIAIPELLSEEILNTACTSKGGICAVAVLPAKFSDHLEKFKAVANRWYGEAGIVNFVWVNEEKQEGWVNAFNVEYFPGLVVLNARKKLYSNFVGTFDEGNMYQFILNIMKGKGQLTKLDAMPKLEKVDKTMPPLNMKEL